MFAYFERAKVSHVCSSRTSTCNKGVPLCVAHYAPFRKHCLYDATSDKHSVAIKSTPSPMEYLLLLQKLSQYHFQHLRSWLQLCCRNVSVTTVGVSHSCKRNLWNIITESVVYMFFTSSKQCLLTADQLQCGTLSSVDLLFWEVWTETIVCTHTLHNVSTTYKSGRGTSTCDHFSAL